MAPSSSRSTQQTTPLRSLDHNSRLALSPKRPGVSKKSPSRHSGLSSLFTSPTKSDFAIFPDDSKENIAPTNAAKSESPSKPKFCRDTKSSSPLSEISIFASPGFVTVHGTTVRLAHNWNPVRKNSAMEIYNGLPAYVTPPRKSLEKVLFKPCFKHFDIFSDDKPAQNPSFALTMDDNKENIAPKMLI